MPCHALRYEYHQHVLAYSCDYDWCNIQYNAKRHALLLRLPCPVSGISRDVVRKPSVPGILLFSFTPGVTVGICYGCDFVL